MVQLISKTKAEGYLVNYYEMLTQTGYVRDGILKKLLLYVFLIDMVEYLHAFIDEKDYAFIEKALARIFTGGNCMLPYPVFCTRRATLGSTDYMTDYVIRITESADEGFDFDEDKRKTELGDIRTTNGYYGDKRYNTGVDVVNYDWRDKEREALYNI